MAQMKSLQVPEMVAMLKDTDEITSVHGIVAIFKGTDEVNPAPDMVTIFQDTVTLHFRIKCPFVHSMFAVRSVHDIIDLFQGIYEVT